MEQNLDLEIIEVLLDSELHVRAIASKIGTNHMTVLRRLNELMDVNVLDCQTQGRNKVYFIKRNAEARSKIFMTELYKLSRILAKHPILRNIITKIQNEPDIKLAVIFGSYAKGTADKESDIDIFIETNDRKIKQSIEKLNTRLSVKIGMFEPKNILAREIIKNHVIIKGVEIYYEKNNFFD